MMGNDIDGDMDSDGQDLARFDQDSGEFLRDG